MEALARRAVARLGRGAVKAGRGPRGLAPPGAEERGSLALTHLVAGAPGRPSLKTLLAIARGAAFVSPLWLGASLAEGRWLPEGPFGTGCDHAAAAERARRALTTTRPADAGDGDGDDDDDDGDGDGDDEAPAPKRRRGAAAAAARAAAAAAAAAAARAPAPPAAPPAPGDPGGGPLLAGLRLHVHVAGGAAARAADDRLASDAGALRRVAAALGARAASAASADVVVVGRAAAGADAAPRLRDAPAGRRRGARVVGVRWLLDAAASYERPLEADYALPK